MRKDLTSIIILVDSSGSMARIQTDAEGSIDAFIADQKRVKGEALVTLYEFNDSLKKIRAAQKLESFEPVRIRPNGNTALYDAAIGAIRQVGQDLSAMPESGRPGKVVFVIITDGQENASREFKLDDVRTEVQHQTDKYGWQFMFLGANMDAFAVGAGIGMQGTNFRPSGAGIRAAVHYASAYVASSRLEAQGSAVAKEAVASTRAIHDVDSASAADFLAKVETAIKQQEDPK